jgi:hypothetical protein
MSLTLHWRSAGFWAITTASLAPAMLRCMTPERGPWPPRSRGQTGCHWMLSHGHRRGWRSDHGSSSQKHGSAPWRRGWLSVKRACSSGPARPIVPPPPLRRTRNRPLALARRADLGPSPGTPGIGRRCWSLRRASRARPRPAPVGSLRAWTPAPTIRTR